MALLELLQAYLEPAKNKIDSTEIRSKKKFRRELGTKANAMHPGRKLKLLDNLRGDSPNGVLI